MLNDFSTRSAGRGQRVQPALNGSRQIHRNTAPFRPFGQGNRSFIGRGPWCGQQVCESPEGRNRRSPTRRGSLLKRRCSEALAAFRVAHRWTGQPKVIVPRTYTLSPTKLLHHRRISNVDSWEFLCDVNRRSVRTDTTRITAPLRWIPGDDFPERRHRRIVFVGFILPAVSFLVALSVCRNVIPVEVNA